LVVRTRVQQDLLQILDDSFRNNFKTLPQKILIALSGGIDSLAMVLVAKEWCSKHNISLTSVTIDHKLRTNSSIEAEEVGKIMEQNNIKHQILVWDREGALVSNIESNARKARYSLLTDYAIKEHISIIVTAHHLDDQIETFFMRLLRGSGIDGLAAIKIKKNLADNIILFRPFLNITKQDLRSFLEERKQQWFEDKTNNDTNFLRNKIRKMLYDIEDKQIIDKRIIQTIKHFERAKDFLEGHTEEVFRNLVKAENQKLIVSLIDFKDLHEEIALRLLIRIFKEINGKYNKPRFKNLLNLYHKIINNQVNKRTTFAGIIIAINPEIVTFEPEK